MASSFLRQIATLSLSSSLPPTLASTGVLSSSFLGKSQSRYASEPLTPALLLAVPRKTSSMSLQNNFTVFAQTVSTTPDTEAEAVADVSEKGVGISDEAVLGDSSEEGTEAPPVPKRKKLTRGLNHLMQILNDDAVQTLSKDKQIPDIRTGDIVQLRVEVPENKKRVSLYRGIVIAKHNAGVNTTFRIRRVIAGVGVEMVFPLYSPNIKEIKVVNSRKVRRAKLYYLRHKLARLSTV